MRPSISPARDPSLTLMVGVDTQVVHGFVNCGATGAITGIGNVLPREALHLVELCRKRASQRRRCCADARAVELDAGAGDALLVRRRGQISFSIYKYLMTLAGRALSTRCTSTPTDAL